MGEYIVSARKYRPLTFDSVVGQHALTTTLKNSIASGKLAHAYLFCGPRGVGKTTCARIFAKSINCLSPLPNGDACGQCESCRAFDEQRSMSISELDAASNNSVEDIRELCKQVLIPPQVGKYKVFIIDEVHMLSPAAFNAFLKTLEEPPSYVIFILATTEKHRILPTILSRCQVYDFQRMSTQDTIAHLQKVAQKEGYETEPEALNLIAQKADGGMRDALSIFDQMVSFTGGKLTYQNVCQSLNVLSTDYYFRLVNHFLAHEVQPCLLLLNEILQKGFDGGNFIAGLSTHLRNLLVARDVSTLALLETSEQMRQKYNEQAMRCRPRFLYKALKLCNDCDLSYRTSNNKRLQLEICLIQATQLDEEDSPGPGLGPAKTLKPIFNVPGAQGPDTSAPQAVQPVAQGHNAQVPLAVAGSSQPQDARPVGQVEEPRPQMPPAAAHVHVPEGGSAGGGAPAKAPLRKVSFRNIGPKKKEDIPNEAADHAGQPPAIPLELDAMRVSWQKYVGTMPASLTAMRQRMQAMQPTLLDSDTICVTVSSVPVRDELESMRPSIERFIRKDQRNCNARIEFRLVQLEEKGTYNKTGHMETLIKRNHAIGQLVSDLELELR